MMNTRTRPRLPDPAAGALLPLTPHRSQVPAGARWPRPIAWSSRQAAVARLVLPFCLAPVPLLSFAAPDAAAPVASRPSLTLAGAEALAAAARAACTGRGKAVAVAVLDASGQTLLLARAEGVGPHNGEAARRKAYTALSTRSATLGLARQARGNADTVNLATLPELLLLGGGVPVWQGQAPVGAIGVAGAGGPEGDDACARAALGATPTLAPQPADRPAP